MTLGPGWKEEEERVVLRDKGRGALRWTQEERRTRIPRSWTQEETGGGGDDALGVVLADVEEGEGQEGGASGASGQEAGGASVEAGGEEGCKRAPNMHSWLYSKEGQGRACLAKLQKGP